MQHFSCARRNAPRRAHFKEQNFILLCDGENETSRSHTNIIKMKRNKLMLIKRLISFKKPFPFNFLAVLALSPRCLLFCSLALSLFLFLFYSWFSFPVRNCAFLVERNQCNGDGLTIHFSWYVSFEWNLFGCYWDNCLEKVLSPSHAYIILSFVRSDRIA